MSDIDMSAIETMTPEQRKEWFVKTAEDYAVKSGYKKPDEITGLAAKNKELLGELKKWQAKARETTESPDIQKARTIAELLEQGGVLSPDDDIELAKQKLQKAVPSDKYAELDVQFRRLKKQFDEKMENEKKLAADLEREREKRFNAEKIRQVASAIDAVNLMPEAKDVFLSHFASMAKVTETDDGKLNIYVEDAEGLAPSIDSYIQAWAKTDKAKPFIKAPVSIGAGVTGGGKGPGGKLSLDDISRIPDRAARIKALKDNGYQD